MLEDSWVKFHIILLILHKIQLLLDFFFIFIQIKILIIIFFSHLNKKYPISNVKTYKNLGNSFNDLIKYFKQPSLILFPLR